MKFFTWCNIPDHPKLEVLNRSAKVNGIQVETLGKGIEWHRNYQKIGLLMRAIRDLDPEEVILCSDAFDVLYLADEKRILKTFKSMDAPIVFGAELLYSHHYPKYKKYWDSLPALFGYRYLNSGTFIGYQKDLFEMLTTILEFSQNYTEKSDQKLYGKYGAKYPGRIKLDYMCELFWCPAGEQEQFHKLYSIECQSDENNGRSIRFKNLKTGTYPCLVHITHAKGYYGLLIKVAHEMEYISDSERVEYYNLHKEELEAKAKKKNKYKSVSGKSSKSKKTKNKPIGSKYRKR